MGIRFNTNTWRAPLLLIGSWLPPTCEQAHKARVLPQVLKRFVHAGWLGRSAGAPAAANTAPRPGPRAGTSVKTRGCPVRVVHATGSTSGNHRADGRLVISGRIADVCAELDRLAALELQSGAQQLRA